VRVGFADVAIDPTTASADQVVADAVRAIQEAGYDARTALGAAGAAEAPAPRGLPVAAACCTPRSA
jgi:hypothetical protein